MSAVVVTLAFHASFVPLGIAWAADGGRTVSLSSKYARSARVVHGSAELFRMSATHSPLPAFPPSLIHDRRHGLVVIELAVSASGEVVDTLILESFDERATASVQNTLTAWRFYSERELKERGMGLQSPGCIRVNRLAFDFLPTSGGQVVDLAAEEIRREGLPNPFRKKSPR